MRCPNPDCTFEGTPEQVDDHVAYMDSHGLHDEVVCLDEHIGDCEGPVEYRMPLSGTGISYPRCAKHWDERLNLQHQIDERYPTLPPPDWSPLDAGESWDEDY